MPTPPLRMIRAARARGLAVILTVVAMLGFGVTTAGTASAASACPSGYSCAYENTGWHNGGGLWAAFEQAISRMSAFGMDNKASSVYNNGNSCNARFYQDSLYGGYSLFVPKGTGYSDLSKVKMSTLFTWNNRVSSGQFVCGG